MEAGETTQEDDNDDNAGGLKGEGSVFWSSSPKFVNSISIVSKVQQKTPLIHRMWTHSHSVQNGLELPEPPVSLMEAGETTKEDNDDDAAEVQDLLTSPLRASTPTVTCTEDDDWAESEPEVMTQALGWMMAHRQRAIGAPNLQGHATEARMDNTTGENELDAPG